MLSMAQLPDLDDLTLSGYLIPMARISFQGSEQPLCADSVDDCYSATDMLARMSTSWLLEVPPGLRFAEVDVYCTRKHLPLAVRPAQACDKTLLKLLHTVIFYGRSHPVPLLRFVDKCRPWRYFPM